MNLLPAIADVTVRDAAGSIGRPCLEQCIAAAQPEFAGSAWLTT